jgi:hypothetical protein
MIGLSKNQLWYGSPPPKYSMEYKSDKTLMTRGQIFSHQICVWREFWYEFGERLS